MPPSPSAFTRDGLKHRLVLDDGGLDTEAAEVRMGGKGGNPLVAERVGKTIVFSCPKEMGLGDRINVKITDGEKGMRWSGRVSELADMTPPRLFLSGSRYDRWRGHFRLHGWGAGLPSDCRIVLFAGDKAVGETTAQMRRPDVVINRPMLDEKCGFDLRVELPPTSEAISLELRAVDACDQVLARAPAPLPDHVGDDTPYRNLKTRAARLPLWRLGKLIASRPFWKRWARPSMETAPSLALLAREVVAAELAERVGPGDEIAVRLSNGDLTLCNPFDDAILARRYLLDGHDELGFLEWLARQVRRGDIAIDAGGAYGVMSRALARGGARVFTVEADATAADRIRRSGLEHGDGRITLVEAALSNEAGQVVFAGMGSSTVGCGKILSGNDADSVAAFVREVSTLNVLPLSMFMRDQKAKQQISRDEIDIATVPAVTLDGLCEEHHLNDVCIVKMDIEGGELMALRGATRLIEGGFGRPPIIAFEYSSLFPTRGGDRTEILDIFLSRGWTLWRLAGGKNGGGGLVSVPDADSAPSHDNLIAVPPGRNPR